MTNKTEIEECTNHEFKVHSGSGISLCVNCGTYEIGHKLVVPKVALKVVNGEICYLSSIDDQSYGMWCPVSYDCDHDFNEGAKFYSGIPSCDLEEIEQLRSEIESLKKATKELISIVEIHSKATENNFAWAEIEFAKEVLEDSEMK